MKFRTSLVLAAIAMGSVACAAKKDAEPAPIAFDVQFPSTSAAVAVDGVKVYVFPGSLSCNDLVRRRQTQQELPATVLVSDSVSPCDLRVGQNNSLELDLDQDYTMLAVGSAAGKDLLVGCTLQSKFGATRAQSISLTFIDANQKIPDTKCTKLSEKCGGKC